MQLATLLVTHYRGFNLENLKPLDFKIDVKKIYTEVLQHIQNPGHVISNFDYPTTNPKIARIRLISDRNVYDANNNVIATLSPLQSNVTIFIYPKRLPISLMLSVNAGDIIGPEEERNADVEETWMTQIRPYKGLKYLESHLKLLGHNIDTTEMASDRLNNLELLAFNRTQEDKTLHERIKDLFVHFDIYIHLDGNADIDLD
jgi:hypothetical protein